MGARSGSFAEYEAGHEKDTERALAEALAETTDESPFVDSVEQLETSSKAVTDGVERAHELFRAVSTGDLLDRGILMGEIDALLGLLHRLDRSGRFEEQLRLTRALQGLLVLTFRWLDLLRSLRAALRSSRAAGDRDGEAWAKHELGTLHLCAGDPKSAEELLGDARRIQQALGHAGGRCATRHNLDCARRDRAAGRLRWRRRLLRAGGVAAVVAVMGSTGTAIALGFGNGNGTEQGTGRITLERTSLDLGRVAVGTIGPARSVRVSNGGSRPLKITRVASDSAAIRVSGDCLSRLRPGADCLVTVRLSPTKAGPISATLTIAGRGARSRTVALAGTGIVTRALSVRPATLAFGDVIVGHESRAMSLFVTAGSEPLTAVVAAGDSPEYTITNKCRTTIPPGERCQLLVGFRPARTGLRPTQLSISARRGERVQIALTGRGVLAKSQAKLNPTSHDFGKTEISSTGEPFRFTLTAGSDRLIPEIRLSTTEEFRLTGGCDGQVALHGNCTFGVAFVPTDEGREFATLTIASRGRTVLTAKVSGTGFIDAPTLAPETHDFGAVDVGSTSASFSFTLRAGSKALDVASSVTPVKEFQVSGNCTTTLEPHEACSLDAVFKPVSEGEQDGLLTVQANSVTLESALKGTGDAVAPVLTPLATDFGSVSLRRQSAPRTFRFSAGSRALLPQTVSIGSEDFSVTRNGCATTLAAFASCTFEVVFRPVAFGTRTAMLSVSASAPPAAKLTGFGWATANWMVKPTRLTLYVGETNQTATRTVTIHVAAQSAAPLLNPRIAVSGSDYFHASPHCRSTMPAGSSCKVTVEFTPTGPLTESNEVATLTISTRNGGRRTIDLHGAFVVE